VLDEWAADQDPLFRRKFYEELLRQLKARGITIIAVTHDDRYYDLADRRLHMEEGRFAGAAGEAGHS
jgi:putative ATP-binding cassette transporter